MSMVPAPRPLGVAAAVVMALRALGSAIASFFGGLIGLAGGAIGFLMVIVATAFSFVSLLFRLVAAGLERGTRLIAALIARIMPVAGRVD